MNKTVSVKDKFSEYKNGKISKDEFMGWLLDENEKGNIDDDTYQKYADEISCDVYLNEGED